MTASSNISPIARGCTEPIEDDPATGYARAVVAGSVIVGPFVRLACARHLRDLDTGAARGLVWFPAQAAYVFGVSRFVRHSKGEWRGKRLDLDPWQKFVVGSAFGWYRRAGNDLVRRFRTVYCEVPKKNGKSTMCSLVGLVGLKFDAEPGAEIYAAASARKQALLVFNDAKEMVRTSPELRDHIAILMSNLSDADSYSKFEPISSDENTGDGVNPHFVIIDELHRIKTRGLRTALTQGFGSRRQPMEWVITTAGDDRPGTPYDEEHNYAVKVLEQVLEDDGYFAYIACPDEDDPWDDPATWAKANPGYRVSVKHEDLAARALKARSSAAELADFKRFRLNLRTSDAQAAIKAEIWRRNSQGRIDEAALQGRACFTAVDLSSKIDISAAVHLFPPAGDDLKWTILPRFWTPADTLTERAERDRAPYGRWVEQGFLFATPGNRVDYRAIVEQLIADAARFRFHDVAFDPYNAGTIEQDLATEGFAVVEFGQTMANYNQPAKEFLAMLLDGAFEHGGNPVLGWMASNVVMITDSKENKMPSKRHSTGRIDGISAAIMALGRAQAHDDPSVYDTRGILFV